MRIRAERFEEAENGVANACHANGRIDRAPGRVTGQRQRDVRQRTPLRRRCGALQIPYIALNPGASYRGLHDSLVNHLGNNAPQMLLCLHEEHAVAIAQGWAKVTGKPMLAAVHSNVGLFHATMAIFQRVVRSHASDRAGRHRPGRRGQAATLDRLAAHRAGSRRDRAPLCEMGCATGFPRRRRARRCSALLGWLERSRWGPVYVNLDADMQEATLAEPLPPLDPARLMPVVGAGAPERALADLLGRLRAASAPVILMGRVGRSEAAWTARVRLAEALGARVITDLKVGAAFPTDHGLHAGVPGVFPDPAARAVIAAADVVLSLDWVDLAGTLAASYGGGGTTAAIIQVSLDHALHNGWSADHQGLPPVDLFVAADPDAVAVALARMVGAEAAAPVPLLPALAAPNPAEALAVPHLAAALRAAVGERPVSLLHLPLSWDGAAWPFRHPLDFLGGDGGGGIGGGPGISVGAALALRGSGRLPVSICGDGDFLMGVTALWTAAHYHIPLLLVVANNQSFFNDEVHQERMARTRDRPVENKWIGMRMTDPELDLAGLARAQGAEGFGPVREVAALPGTFAAAIDVVEAGGVAVVDVRVATGYTPAMASALTRHKP